MYTASVLRCGTIGVVAGPTCMPCKSNVSFDAGALVMKSYMPRRSSSAFAFSASERMALTRRFSSATLPRLDTFFGMALRMAFRRMPSTAVQMPEKA